jgi:hypothetical protein
MLVQVIIHADGDHAKFSAVYPYRYLNGLFVGKGGAKIHPTGAGGNV